MNAHQKPVEPLEPENYAFVANDPKDERIAATATKVFRWAWTHFTEWHLRNRGPLPTRLDGGLDEEMVLARFRDWLDYGCP